MDSGDLVPSQNIDDFLERAAEFVANGETHEVDDQTYREIQKVSQSNTAKLIIFQHILAMKKATRLQKLHKLMDSVEGKLFSSESLEHITNPDTLIRLGTLLKDQAREDAAYVDNIVKEGGANAATVQSFLHQMEVDRNKSEDVEILREIPPQKREDMRDILQSFGKSDKEAE